MSLTLISSKRLWKRKNFPSLENNVWHGNALHVEQWGTETQGRWRHEEATVLLQPQQDPARSHSHPLWKIPPDNQKRKKITAWLRKYKSKQKIFENYSQVMILNGNKGSLRNSKCDMESLLYKVSSCCRPM
jgi:hypothetical protein